MELKEFVKATLTAIVEGVAEAQEGPHGGNISPAGMAGAKVKDAYTSTWGMPASPVRFDVALTVTGGSEAKGGGHISVVGLGLGATGTKTHEEQSVSRVQFDIAVAMPTTRKKPIYTEKAG